MTHEYHELLIMAVAGQLTPPFMDKKIYCGSRKTGRCEVTVNGLPLDPRPSWDIRSHSPAGYSWGYGGSGPSQLALAILLDFTGDQQEAEATYMEFKWKFVATWGDTWQITGEQIREWLTKERLK